MASTLHNSVPRKRFILKNLKDFVFPTAEKVPAPTNQQLVKVAVYNAVPFIGFGFLDNFIMIVAVSSATIIYNVLHYFSL